jgi:uncharacterized protein DUF4157
VQQQRPQPAVVSPANGSLETNPSGEFFDLQREVGNQVVGDWLKLGIRKPLRPSIQTKPTSGESVDPAEQQADRAAEEVTKQADTKLAKSLIVEDDAKSLETGQMRKSEFLAQLRTASVNVSEEALKGTMWSTMGCPYIERWISHYEGQTAQHVERAVQKYTPEARGVSNARDYIPVVTNRLRRGINQWRETGEVPADVPPEFTTGGMPGMTAGALLGGLVGGALSAVGSAVSGLVSGAGKALSGLGRMLFKEREGGATEPDDPGAIQAQLGSGRALDGRLKSKMESAYGADFSDVRVHTDGKAHELSDNLNARAFTVGTDIAFGTGEYHPGTIVGDALIAHELAHVVQQGAGSSAATPQTKPAPARSSFEQDADLAAAGAVISVWGGAKAKPQPRRRSGLQLQRCGGANQAVKGEKKLSAEELAHARFRSEKVAARDTKLTEAGTSLRELGAWVATEQKKQGRPEITAVVDLDPKLRDNARQAVTNLQTIGPTFETKGLDGVVTKLNDAVTNAKGAKKYIGREEREFQLQMRLSLNRAGDSLDEAVAALEKLNDSVDGYELWKEIENARAILEGAKGTTDPYDAIEKFAQKIKTITDTIHQIQEKYKRYPAAIARIAFVVQYFLAINTPGFAGLPSADEIKKFRGTLAGGLSGDFSVVFVGEGVNSPFEIFTAYADVLEKQLATLDKMSTAGTPAKTPIPTQDEVESYFKKLAKKPNAEVRKAYEDYAQGYFYHRIVTTLDDMAVTDVSDLYKRKLSIAGTRPLVCSGYAILGADLFTLAGGRVTTFISAVRATNEQIRSNTIDEGHALAQISRQGKTFFVSNYLTFDKEKDAMDVAWAHPNAPMIRATGPTNNAALEALREQLRRRM